MNSVQFLFTLLCAVLATSQAIEDGNIDVALQTTLEFDGTDEDSDSAFDSKMKDILEKIKTIMTSTRRLMIANKVASFPKKLDAEQIGNQPVELLVTKAPSGYPLYFLGNKKLNGFLENAVNLIDSLNQDDLKIISSTIKRELQRRSRLEQKHRDLFEIPFRRTGRSRSKVRKSRPDRTTTREDLNNSEKPKDVGFNFKDMSDNIVNWFNNVFNPDNVESKPKTDDDHEEISKKETKSKSQKRKRKHKGKQKLKVPEDKEERSEDKQMLQSLTGMIQSLLVDQFQSLKTQGKKEDRASSDADSSKDELGKLLESYLKPVQAKEPNPEPTKKKNLSKRFKKISNCSKNVSENRKKRKRKNRMESNSKEKSLTKEIPISGPSSSKKEKKLKVKKNEESDSKTDKHKSVQDTAIAKLVKKAGSPSKALRKIQEIQEMLLKSINGTTDDKEKSTSLVLDNVVINVIKEKSTELLDRATKKKRKTSSNKHKKKSTHDKTSEDNSVQKVPRVSFNRARSEASALFPVSDNGAIADITERRTSYNNNSSDNGSNKQKGKTTSRKHHKNKSTDDNASEDNSVQKVARLHFNRARSEEWPLFPVSDNEVVAELTKRTRNETKPNGFTSNEANTNKVILVSKSTQDNDYVTEFSTGRVKVDHAKQSASTTTKVAAADVSKSGTESGLAGKLDERVPLIQQSRATLNETDVY